MRSLRTWLALGLLVGVVVPAGVGVGAWVAAGAWQTHRELARRDAALRLVATTAPDDPALPARLTALGVEAELRPGKLATVTDKDQIAQLVVVTPGLQAIRDAAGKQALAHGYTSYTAQADGLDATLWVRDESVAARWAIALAAAGVVLVGVLFAGVALLQRWVLRPLATLAADADRIAGGELAVAPIATRAREVAQVGDALSGMAGALGRALDASAASERERRFLMSAIAHDLRTPLFTLRGSLEAIEHGIGDTDALARARRKADHLDRLVGDLFAFARAESAREAYTLEPVDLAEIAQRAVESVGAPVELVTEGPARVQGDPVALERALTNVLDNAVRHARGHTRVEVTRSTVTVIDDGPGFSDADLPHVFEPMYRGDRARSGGGAGLGLAIARRLARAHGGDVEAGNEPGGGARVTVSVTTRC